MRPDSAPVSVSLFEYTRHADSSVIMGTGGCVCDHQGDDGVTCEWLSVVLCVPCVFVFFLFGFARSPTSCLHRHCGSLCINPP